MKYVNDDKMLADVFGISNRSFINNYINDFKSNCGTYVQRLEKLKNAKKEGIENLRNIETSVNFIRDNPLEKKILN